MDARRTTLAVLGLLVGVACALVSVYASTRLGCAAWVTLAVVLTFGAGGLLGSERSRRVDARR